MTTDPTPTPAEPAPVVDDTRGVYAIADIEIQDALGRRVGRTQQVSGLFPSVAAWLRAQADAIDPPPAPRHKPGFRGSLGGIEVRDTPAAIAKQEAAKQAALIAACPDCGCPPSNHGRNRKGCIGHPECNRSAMGLAARGQCDHTGGPGGAEKPCRRLTHDDGKHDDLRGGRWQT